MNLTEPIRILQRDDKGKIIIPRMKRVPRSYNIKAMVLAARVEQQSKKIQKKEVEK